MLDIAEGLVSWGRRETVSHSRVTPGFLYWVFVRAVCSS